MHVNKIEDHMIMPDAVRLLDRDDLGQVRDEIVASWRRSLFSGLRPDTLHVPYDAQTDTESQLERIARPVLTQLAAELHGTGMILVLTSEEGRVLQRWVPDPALNDGLDAVWLAPGYLYGEEHVGTSSIGLAIEHRRPAFVEGREHFAEALTHITCGAAPIVDPRTRRVIGVVSIASHATIGNPLMLPMATRVAREIEQRLLEEAKVTDHALFDHYLRTANRTSRPVVSLNGDTMITNEAAARLLQPADHAILRELAKRTLARKRLETATVTLSSDTSVSAQCEPVFDGADVVGITVRLSPSPEKVSGSAGPAPRAPELPGLIGASDLWQAMCMKVQQAARSATVVHVVGELGVGKLAVAKALLRSINERPVCVHDAAEASHDPAGWLDTFDRLLEDTTIRIVLRHAHLLDDALSYQVGNRLEKLPVDGPARVVVTGDVVGDEDARGWTLRYYAAATVTVPPLRRRREDIPVLFNALLSRMRKKDEPLPELAPDALRALVAYAWPANVRQLRVVAGHVVQAAPGAMVQLADLPTWLHTRHPRRQLSPRERLEFDAIVDALQAVKGNRVQAATRLGMARSTLYRKIAAFGVDPDEFVVETVAPGEGTHDVESVKIPREVVRLA